MVSGSPAWVLLFGFLALSVMSGCVGGPASYMKEVSTEMTTSEPTSLAAPTDLIVAPIQSAELEPVLPPAGPSQPASRPAIAASAQKSPVQVAAAGSLNIMDPAATIDPANDQPELQQQSLDGTRLALLPTQDENSLPGISGSLGQGEGFAIGTGGEPFVDPLEAAAEARIKSLYGKMKHGQCKSGRGPVPHKVNARNIQLGDPYYIEIRMRHTPLLPVGHTYVAYGRLSPTGEILDEKLIMLAPFGGYAGAALASGIPMPGVLDPHPDDCRIRPKAAYRVSLNAQRYEKLLMEVQKARIEKPGYLLFTYNCNHFASRIAASVGIKPPANIYVPALEYIYAMIDSNEGGKIARN